ncbi:MAG: MFS transporter, partial [Deltaproteobacteria bacterium]|nr:MFS transporter [Deltaproteobacteria bacterium]
MNKRIFSWCLFDFANSSYSAVIAAVIFPVYYTHQIVGSEGLGDLWWGRAIALSMAIVAITSPLLGGIADYTGVRKRLLLFYTTLCISSVASFYFLQNGMVFEGFLLIVLANIGMEGGLV